MFLIDCQKNKGILKKPLQVGSFARENLGRVEFSFLDGGGVLGHFVCSVKFSEGVVWVEFEVLECV